MDPDDEVELLSADAQMHITAEVRALEVTLVHDLTYECSLANIELRAFSPNENDPSMALGISVESRGCYGYQYTMELSSSRAPDD
jgi:hypothetical protein